MEAYQNSESAVVALGGHVKTTVQNWCEQRNYLFTSRSKDADSLAEKLESGRFPTWSAIDDRFACTVVVPTTTHESGVLLFLDAVFKRETLRSRNSAIKAPDVFRFDSTRWIGKLRPEVGLALAPGAGDLQFEVQVQTVFENAWGVVTHDLVYKADTIDWRKARLAAQLKAAVEQIEMTIAGFEANLDHMPQSKHPETDEKVAIVAALKTLISDGRLTQELVPRSWSRLADNIYELVSSYTPRPSDRPRAVRDLRKSLVSMLTADDRFIELRSGSLFQIVVGHIAASGLPNATLDGFVIVNSPELGAFHALSSVPKPFLFS